MAGEWGGGNSLENTDEDSAKGGSEKSARGTEKTDDRQWSPR